MTTWYEGYYDVWLGGQYIHQIAKLHKEYGKLGRVTKLCRQLTCGARGPLIRINPHEVHCNDPNFIDEVFPGPSRKTNKYRFTGRRTLSELSLHPSHR